MLQIRRQQMKVLWECGMTSLAETFLRKNLSDDCQAIGPEAVRQSITLALHKAKAYGLEEPDAVLRYLNVMYTIGFLFDEDPQYPWATTLLGNKRMRPASKMDLLCHRVRQELAA